MADEQTPDTTALPAGLSQDQINQLLTSLHLGQGLPNVQPDQTPVDSSGFGGGLRRVVSLLGEFAGSPGPETFKALSPREREEAGIQALSRFGTGLLQASGSGKWIGSNLGDAFARAERGYDQTTRQAIGSLAARQSYAAQGEQANLDRLKAAIPLLSLQRQMQAVAGTPYTVGSGGAAAPSTNIAAGGSISVPPEYLPYYAEASARTGIPVEVLIAQGKQEGNFDPTATGKAGEIGIHQILPATAKSPGFGMTGVDPATLRDPRANINFAADYLKARGGPRTDFSNPATVAAALKGYNGGGDPDYVAHVMRYVPGAASAIAPKTASATLVPPAPTGGDPNAPVTIPPRVQVAGPGAGTTLPAPIAPPGQEAPVVPPPSAPVIPPQAPGSGPPVFNYRPSSIPPGLIPSGTFTPEQRAAVKTIEDAYVHERQVALTPADVQKAEANFGTNMTKVLGSQTDAAKVATDALLKFHEADFKQQQDTHSKMLADYIEQQKFTRENEAKVAAAALAHKNALEAKEAEQNGTVVVDDRKRFATERDGARKSIDNLQTLRALSEAAGISGPLDRVTLPSGIKGRDLMASMGLGTEEQRRLWSGQQAFEAFKNNVIVDLRAGIAMGQLSDRDLAFIQGMGPDLIQHPETRQSILNILETAQSRKREYIDNVNQLYESGVPWTKAKREADKAMPEVVPQVPAGLTPEQRLEFFRQHIPKGSIFRGPDSTTHDGKRVRGDIMVAPRTGY